jgi:hypothetical protein
MEETMEHIFCRDLVALPLVVNNYIVRRKSWMGDQYIDLDVEKFNNGRSERFLVIVKDVAAKLQVARDFRKEAEEVSRKYGIATYIAVVAHNGKSMMVDAELRPKMHHDPQKLRLLEAPSLGQDLDH